MMPAIRRTCSLLAACAAVALIEASSPAGPLPADIAGFLTKTAAFGEADLAALEAGRVISKAQPGTAANEVFVVAAVKIRSTRERVSSYFGQMVKYVDGEITRGFGRFSTPPRLSDVATLTLDREDLDALRSCQPGDCDVRIGGSGIESMRRAVNWNALNAAEQAQQAVRKAVVDYVTAYQGRGDQALVTYNDRSRPVSLAAEWGEILAGSKYFHQYQPALRDYITRYPQVALPGSQDIMYWVKEKFTGLKPIISVVHAIVYDAPGAANRTTILQKQIYASRYYDASVAHSTVAETAEAGKPVTYLVYGTRARGDMMKGGFGGLKGGVVRSQARKGAEGTLETIKSVLERAPGR